ncbi:conserved hypothetical protein [Nitrosococcus watsonii C-113]|uniref:PEP-CTERM/exosortase system-associated acyltransferase n=2 Tax=Nitrosococcus TaxID=1227 RepID=D8K6X4_NITWC|nr:conserved hypothetical protein [Nitrosococcus watsonii C-113]
MSLSSICKSDPNRRLIDTFFDYFEIVPVNTTKLLETVHHLRYQVYCVETGFEDPNLYRHQLEKDEFDPYSVYSLLRHRRTGIYAGTVRLILPRTDTEKCFPIHKVTNHPLFLNHHKFPRTAVGAVSRFAISKHFRKRLGEFSSPTGMSQQERSTHRLEERRIIPHLMLGLVAGLVSMSVKQGIEHWFCMVEPSLLRLLSRYGLQLIPCGPMIDHHGKRQPCYAHLSKFLETAYTEQPAIWELITDEGRNHPLETTRRYKSQVS